MFKKSNDTTVNAGVSTASNIAILREMLINMRVRGESQFIVLQADVHDDFYVLGLGEGPDSRVKPFFNPLSIDIDEDTYLIVDVRTCTRFDRTKQVPVIANPALFRREVVRTILEDVWIGLGSSDILNLGNYQITVFAHWFAEIITKRFALDAEQQLRITTIVAYYYLCLFSEEGDIDKRRAIPTIVSSCNLATGFVIETLNDVEYMANIEELLEQIKTSVASDRLSGLDLQIALAMLGGSWFGANNALLVGIAIEFPPTWVALLYLSLTDRTHRANGIATVALRKERDANTRNFVAATSRLLIAESTISPKDIKGGL